MPRLSDWFGSTRSDSLLRICSTKRAWASTLSRLRTRARSSGKFCVERSPPRPATVLHSWRLSTPACSSRKPSAQRHRRCSVAPTWCQRRRLLVSHLMKPRFCSDAQLRLSAWPHRVQQSRHQVKARRHHCQQKTQPAIWLPARWFGLLGRHWLPHHRSLRCQTDICLRSSWWRSRYRAKALCVERRHHWRSPFSHNRCPQHQIAGGQLSVLWTGHPLAMWLGRRWLQASCMGLKPAIPLQST